MPNSTQPLRWGLLSTANINRSVIPAIRASKRNVLSAVASRAQTSGDAYAQKWDIGTVFGSYEAMLASPDIDVVYNSLPNGLHKEWTIAAAKAGKHVLCEKPFALSLADVDAMAAAARDNKVVIAEAFMYRHHPQTALVKSIVQSGEIGELRLVRGAFTFNISKAADVRLNAEIGGGSVWDVGCYPISFGRYLFGAEPVQAQGFQTVGAVSGVDEMFSGTLCFANGGLLQFDSGFRAPFRTHLEVVGSAGIIVVPRPFKPTAREEIMVGPSADQLAPRAVEGFEQLYSGEVEDMTDAILFGKTQQISHAETRGNIAAILALLQAAKEGKTVAV